MNKIVYYTIGAFLLLWSSCTNENYLKYDSTLRDGLYVEHFKITLDDSGVEKKEVMDSAFYNFGFSDITEYTYNIRCAIMGIPRDFDREISIKMNNSKYADNEFIAAKSDYYEIPDRVIVPGNAVEVMIPVKLKRHTELENTRAILTIEVVANENFDIKGNSEFTLTFDDKTPPTPIWWLAYRYGEFTKFKGQLFFKYFWEMEQENEYMFNKIVTRFGRNLDKQPIAATGQNNPTVAFSFAFSSMVQLKAWEYSEAHPELNLNIAKPNF